VVRLRFEADSGLERFERFVGSRDHRGSSTAQFAKCANCFAQNDDISVVAMRVTTKAKTRAITTATAVRKAGLLQTATTQAGPPFGG
jgi:hypothetical protein